MRSELSAPPVYSRMLRLRHVRPGGVLCLLFFEGTIAVGVLLALAELASWWSVAVLPVTVAAMVKVNDVVAGALGRSAGQDPPPMMRADGPPAMRADGPPAMMRADGPPRAMVRPAVPPPSGR